MRYIIAGILLTLCCCRSANWHLKKAIDKGAKIDSTTVIIHDSIKVNMNGAAVMDETFVDVYHDVDTVVLRELCAEPVKQIKKLQRTICPQVDTVYNIKIEVEDKVYDFPIKVELRDGGYKLVTKSLKIPYKKAQTDVHLATSKGFSAWEGVYLALGAISLGMILGGFIWAKISSRRGR